MENFVLSVPQGMYVCIDIKDFNKQTNQKQIDVIFTDNLLPCSYFFIKDIHDNFVIFAHMDASMNIIDPENGLFAILEKKRLKYKLSNKDIEIYFEHGSTSEPAMQIQFSYEKYIRNYLKEKGKGCSIQIMQEIEPNKETEVDTLEEIRQQYYDETQRQDFRLIYDISHKDATGDYNRRYAAFDI